MNSLTPTCWINGAFLPLEEARVPVLDRGFLFADGIYEVTGVVDGRLVDADAHLTRLARSAAALALPLPWTTAELLRIQAELVKLSCLTEGIVYLQVTRGAADRDFVIPARFEPNLVLFTQAKKLCNNPLAEAGVSVAAMPDLRWARRDIKSIMLLAQVMAKQAAIEAGAYEAWLIEDGFVTECASSSALIVTDRGTLVTRPNSQAILPGCTRRAVLELAARDSVPIEERLFTLDEALAAREAIMTSASTFLLPIVRIDGRPIADGRPGPIARRLRELYIDAARRS